MDVTSYLLGKKASGGGGSINNQNKNITITENGTTTVSADAGYTGLGTVGITANVGGGVSDYFMDTLTSAQASSLIKKMPSFSFDPSLESLQSCFEYYGNLKEIGTISNTSQVTNFQKMFRNCFVLEAVPSINTSSGVYFTQMFDACRKITSVPQYNTSSGQTFNNMFRSCYALISVPVFDLSSATSLSNMFSACDVLSDESLNNIMASCMTTTSAYTGEKTLTTLGLNNTQKNKCATLSNYDDFVSAGWSA